MVSNSQLKRQKLCKSSRKLLQQVRKLLLKRLMLPLLKSKKDLKANSPSCKRKKLRDRRRRRKSLAAKPSR